MYPHRIHLQGPWQLQAGQRTMALRLPVLMSDLASLRSELPWHWRRAFRWPTSLLPFERLWLTLEACGSPLSISLNGQNLGMHQHPCLPWSAEISPWVRLQNVLEVEFLSSPLSTLRDFADAGWLPEQPWRGGFLEVRRDIHLADLRVEPLWQNTSGGTGDATLRLTTRLHGRSEKPLEVVMRLDQQEILYQKLPKNSQDSDRLEVVTSLLRLPLWQPGVANTPHLLEIHLLDPACLLDQQSFTTSFRQVRKDQNGTFQINGEVRSGVRMLMWRGSVLEAPELRNWDQCGQGVCLQLPANPTPDAYAPYFWHNPSVLDYSLASNSMASRKP
jgi:hypothetical protein